MNWFAFLSIALCSVSGIKLPGRCPKAPPSHYLDQGTRSVIYSVPFTMENPSYLFREIYAITDFTIHFERSLNIGEHFIIKSITSNVSISNKCTSFAKRGNDSIGIISAISIDNHQLNDSLECQQLIEEDIRVWYDDKYIFIWSCVENEASHDRDEAVIICAFDKTILTNITVDPQKMTKVLQNVAMKYVSEALAKEILYPSNLWISANKELLFVCPVEKQDLFVIIAIFGVVLSLLVIMWHIC